MMNRMKTHNGDRRQYKTMPKIPFKDRNGLIIRECRRKSRDRRLGIIDLKYFVEADNDLEYFLVDDIDIDIFDELVIR